MANRNRVPPPEADGPRPPPPAARPVPRTRPPGSLGTAAHPQHRGHRHRPRRRIRQPRPRPYPVHRRARPRPLPHRRRHLLPALRPPPRQRGCPAGQPGRRDPHPAPPPSGPPADLRQDRNRTTNQAHRRSHLHHRHHKVESPEMGHNSGNLRAVGLVLAAGSLILTWYLWYRSGSKLKVIAFVRAETSTVHIEVINCGRLTATV